MSPLVIGIVLAAVAGAAPLRRPHDLDAVLDGFLERLYDDLHDDEQMQGDQPPEDRQDLGGLFANLTHDQNMTEYFRTSRNRQREIDVDDRAKDNWIQVLKENILRQIGRSNMTTGTDGVRMNTMNMSMMPDLMNRTVLEDDHITEKIRSYYPSCDIPSNMEQELWRDDNVMNLHFNNFDHNRDEKELNIATATLRLYRIPTENSTKTKTPDCDTGSSEDDRLLRVSIYWYTRSVRKKKVKRRLSDSKVIPETARWVELSVKPAARAWSKGRNLGLAVIVEDQEGTVLKADRFFKGALCMPLRNQFRQSSSTPPANQTNLTDEFIAYLDEIQRRPYLVTYQCYQQ